MPTIRSSQNRRAFDLFLRTGHWPESKYNHSHDELGRFTFADGSGGMAARQSARPQAARVQPRLAAKPKTDPVALDTLSAAEETAHKDPGTVSSGGGDKGGISYGSYQLSTNMGTAAEFVASPEAQPWADRLGGLTPATPEFGTAWQAAAASDPAGFEAAQKAFIVRTKYDATARILARNPVTDISGASPVVKAVVYSTAVQHGQSRAAQIVSQSIAETDGVLRRNDPRWQATLITRIYDHRIRIFDAASRRYALLGKSDKARNSHNVATNRLPRESSKALKLLGGS